MIKPDKLNSKKPVNRILTFLGIAKLASAPAIKMAFTAGAKEDLSMLLLIWLPVIKLTS